jgi:large subunit ribosomal protein L13
MVVKAKTTATKKKETSSEKKTTKVGASAKTQKRATKSEKTAKKSAAKTKVRTSRTTKRAEKADVNLRAKKGTSASRWKVKHPGHAPHSSRVTAPKGPVKSLASKTSFSPKDNDERRWLVVDVADQTVGRVASQIASLLRGKHKTSFTPNNDVGDFVIVINCEKVKFAGNKETQKTYNWHTGYISGLKETTPARLRETFPDRILEKAVKGMVPRTPLGRAQMTKLKIYKGSEHPHAAQNPVAWKLRYDSTIGEE